MVGLLSAVTAVVATGYYWLLIQYMGQPTDVQPHVDILYKACVGQGSLPANFGFYQLVYLLSGFSSSLSRLLSTALVAIAVAWGSLVGVSSYAGSGLLRRGAVAPGAAAGPAPGMVGLAAVCSCLLFPLPFHSQAWYLGTLPPNVYHNSTVISAMPFSVLAFAYGVRRLSADRAARLPADLLLSLLLVVGAVFKPSYAFAFVPAFGLLFALKSRFRLAQLLRLALVLLPVALVIGGQLAWTNHHPNDTLGGASRLGLGFPAGWRTFVPDYGGWQVLACAASSFLLPVAAYGLRPDWLRRPAHQLALLSLLVGFGIFQVVYETGIRALHGNFVWQVVAANHVLHWVIVLEVMAWVPADVSQRRKRKALQFLIALEVLSGVAYLVRFLFLGM
ncbi:hypothetical protein [Hymenobacter daeguensis]